jgi:hypothetical protein
MASNLQDVLSTADFDEAIKESALVGRSSRQY